MLREESSLERHPRHARSDAAWFVVEHDYMTLLLDSTRVCLPRLRSKRAELVPPELSGNPTCLSNYQCVQLRVLTHAMTNMRA